MKKTLLILLIVSTNAVFSQQLKVTRDLGLWGGFNLQKDLSKGFSLNLEQQIRLYKNATKFDDYLVDFGTKYKINKNFGLGVNVRYTYNDKRVKEAENNFRYNLDLRYKGKMSKKTKVYYRLRYQKEFVNLFTSDGKQNIYSSGIRNRIKIRYKHDVSHKLYVSGELFRLIENYRDPYFNKIRWNIGDEWKTDIGVFDFSLGGEHELNSNHPLTFFFLKIKYTLKL